MELCSRTQRGVLFSGEDWHSFRAELATNKEKGTKLGCRCNQGWLPEGEPLIELRGRGRPSRLKLRDPTVAALSSFFVREESEKAARPVSASTKESQPRRVLLLTSRGMVQLPASGGL